MTVHTPQETNPITSVWLTRGGVEGALRPGLEWANGGRHRDGLTGMGSPGRALVIGSWAGDLAKAQACHARVHTAQLLKTNACPGSSIPAEPTAPSRSWSPAWPAAGTRVVGWYVRDIRRWGSLVAKGGKTNEEGRGGPRLPGGGRARPKEDV